MSLARRDMLGLLLGAPLAALACRRAASCPPGSLVLPTPALGHRLRPPAAPPRVGDATNLDATALDVVVVGGGPAGLAAAWRLARRGVERLQVLELEAQPGGTSAFGEDGPVPHPFGAHYLPVPDSEQPELVALLDELGVLEPVSDGALARVVRGREGALVRAPEERLFVGGRWQPGLFPRALATADELRSLARFRAEVDRWVAFRDAEGRRAFAVPTRRCSRAPEVTALDDVSAASYLDALGVVGPAARFWLEHATRDEYGARLADVSAWALLFYFCARVPAPGADSSPFLTWPEGNGRLVRHLADVAGPRLRVGQLVTDVEAGGAGVELAVVDARSGELRRVTARRAIVALPRFVAERVVAALRGEPPARFSYSPWVVANVQLSERPRSVGAPPAWDNVLYQSTSLGYVDASHQTLRTRGPTVLTWYHAVDDGDPPAVRARLEQLDHEHYADAVVSELSVPHPELPSLVRRVDVARWAHGMVRPTVGALRSAARARATAPRGPVHFAHSDLGGMPLFEEAFDQGVRAADEVVASLAAPDGG